MRARLPVVAIVVLACAALPLAGCSSEQRSLDVIEGEPLHLGDVSYNVALSRFLNPHDAEDAGYLAGQPPTSRDVQYFGVFINVANSSSEDKPIGPMRIIDTRGNSFRPIASESPYALPLLGTVPADDEYPLADTTARYGPIEGSLVLFKLPDFVTENRPIELEILGEDREVGHIELDL